MSGFIAIQRDALEHPVLAEPLKFHAFFWMVAKACWKPTPFDVNGRIITLERGQFCCSMRDLAASWGWSKSAVERFLARLKTEAMIETSSKTGRLIISITNYSKYQDVPDRSGTDGETPSGTGAGQERDIKEPENQLTNNSNNKKYTWHGEIIRLNQRDYDKWENTYSLVDLPPALFTRDAWLQSQPESVQKQWIHSTKNWLNRLQQDARRAANPKDEPWDGHYQLPPGCTA